VNALVSIPHSCGQRRDMDIRAPFFLRNLKLSFGGCWDRVLLFQFWNMTTRVLTANVYLFAVGDQLRSRPWPKGQRQLLFGG